jgi:hypothetical protein
MSHCKPDIHALFKWRGSKGFAATLLQTLQISFHSTRERASRNGNARSHRYTSSMNPEAHEFRPFGGEQRGQGGQQRRQQRKASQKGPPRDDGNPTNAAGSQQQRGRSRGKHYRGRKGGVGVSSDTRARADGYGIDLSQPVGMTEPDGPVPDKDPSSLPSCILCCEPMHVVAFGECGHKASCEKCLLRLRMCYKNYDCPMCKHEMREIVLAPWRDPMPQFSDYKSKMVESSRIVKQLGDGIVYVDKCDHDRLLLNQVLNMVGTSCPACNKESKSKITSERRIKTFKSNKHLIEHMKSEHPQCHLCRMCLDEQRQFALDQVVYDSTGSLKNHKKDSHPMCKFCRRSFFDGDAIWQHMIQEHFQCQLCQREEVSARDDNPDAWYRNAPELQLHLANDHFACEHESCMSCLVAFLTLEELQKHHIDHHSNRMRRWDPQNSRRLDVDFSFNRHGNSRVDAQPGAQTQRRVHFELESRGGLEVIDDHDFSSFPSLTSSSQTHAPRYQRDSIHRHRMDQQSDQFPSLAIAHSSSSNNLPMTSTTRRLVSHQVRCPCGRRKTNQVVPEGDSIPPLECDGICRLEGAKEDRKKQLDAAFGIDSDAHLSRFERRKSDWPNPQNATLLQAAKTNLNLIQDYEKLLEAFLKSPAARKVLPPAPRSHRKVLHQMATAYGLSSVSMGAEPKRSIQLFKPIQAKAGIPDELLSSFITTFSLEDVDALLQASKGFQIRFTDVSRTADLHHHIRNILSSSSSSTTTSVDVENDSYILEWEDDLRTSAVASFKSKEHAEIIRNSLQGGIRGLFRVEYGI